MNQNDWSKKTKSKNDSIIHNYKNKGNCESIVPLFWSLTLGDAPESWVHMTLIDVCVSIRMLRVVFKL
jgi:hypothetical protein